MKKVRTLGTKRWVCAILAWALLLTPSLTLAAGAPEQTAAAQPLTLESIPAELAQTLELDGLSPLAELNDADEEQLNSLTISNGDGTSTAYIFQGPIKYLDKETNSIKFIDNKLKASNKSSGFLEKYAYENTANDIKVYLPKKIKQGVDMEYQNISINMRPEIVNNEKGLLKEYAFAGETMEVMEYPDAFGQGYHLQYQPINRGLKENILVEKYNGTNSFSFELKLKKGSAELSEDNRIIYIKDENGERVFILNQPYARDSYVGIDPELKHRTFDDYYILEQTGSKTYRVTMVIDPEFFASKETVYPVLIDPSVYMTSYTISDTTVLSSGGTSYGPASEFVSVGYFGSIYYSVYSKSSINTQYRYIRPDNILFVYHRAYVTSLTNTGTITVYDSNRAQTVSSSLSYQSVMENAAGYVTSEFVSGQGQIDFDITSLGVKWLKQATGESGGKAESCGYIFTSGGPGTILLSSAEHSTKEAYIAIGFSEDTSAMNGTYYIKNKGTGKYLTQVSGSTNINASNQFNNDRQLWEISLSGYALHAFYDIKNKDSRQYLGSSNLQPFALGAVPVANATSQTWRVVKNTDGTYRLFASNSQYCLEVNSNNNQIVRANAYSGAANQKWELVPAFDQIAIKLTNGTYIRHSKTGSNGRPYTNEAGIALEVNKSKQIIVETLDGSTDVQAILSYSMSDYSKITLQKNNNTYTITGKELGRTTITFKSSTKTITLDVVVADKVLDVPLERQVWSQSCWAACGSMAIKGMISSFNYPLQLADDVHNNDENYPAYNDTQYDIIEEVKGGRIKNNTNNKPASSDDIINALKGISDNTLIGHYVPVNDFSQTMLRQKLDDGSPVIYLSGRYDNNERVGGHFRVIYGYYWLESANKYVYLVHEPYDFSNFHLDIWERSWENILNEKENDINGLDRPETNDYTYKTENFIYFSLEG